jgi:hypothetical protein
MKALVRNIFILGALLSLLFLLGDLGPERKLLRVFMTCRLVNPLLKVLSFLLIELLLDNNRAVVNNTKND